MNYAHFVELCAAKGETPKSISRKIGLANGNTNSWKNGGNPSMDVLIKLMKELDCSADELISPLNMTQKPALGENCSNIINRIINICEEKGIQQQAVCNALGITSGTFSTWKKRGTDPEAKYIPLISEVLGVSMKYILTGKDSAPLHNTEKYEYSLHNLNEHEEELVECYRKLSDFAKGEVLGDIKRRVANINNK